MAADPRTHRRYREHRQRGLAALRALHDAGQPITCRLCGHPLDPWQPTEQGRNPTAPTLEHVAPLAHGGPLFQPTDASMWAHRVCQSRQGAQITNARQASRPGPRRNSRQW